MHYLFNDEITEESVNNLVERLQNCEENINLWFSTCGGSSSAMTFLISYLNSIKDKITITVTEKLLSAGTSILTDFKGGVVLDLDDLDCILFHVADREGYSFRKDSHYCDNKILAKQDKEYNIAYAEKIRAKKLLTEKQIKQFLNGKDVLVYKEQFSKYKL